MEPSTKETLYPGEEAALGELMRRLVAPYYVKEMCQPVEEAHPEVSA
jgi:hypothetical protein